ncbi:ABC transporter ATP-binding protein [Propionicicella superfundia]|uniref:ABC transporter ATP-binding protein n=1 Tax=Propionicicella superfundia TaxID=348582 RepID=UPI0003F5C218|nr:ABC transporter ATP-binding protein [Propionicicella superfundia]
MSTPALEFCAVGMRYGTDATAVHALRDVSLTVTAGELVAVMGPSGSGKSTLLAIAGTLLSPTEGDVLISGTSLREASRKELAGLRRRSLGFVFQDFNLLPALTVIENTALPLELDGLPRAYSRAQAREVLASVGLSDRLDAYPDELSGGQQQRIAIARAVVGERSLVLADEPTGALDSATGEEVMRLLRGRVDAGAAGVLVTHEATHAAWADRIVFLRDGRLVDETARDDAGILLTGSRG